MARKIETIEELLNQKKSIEAKIERRRQRDIEVKNESFIKLIKSANLYHLTEHEFMTLLESVKSKSVQKDPISTD